MAEASAIPAQVKSVRRQTLALLDDLAKKGKANELPAPPAALEDYRLKLLDNIYKVLVAGEMKRGKSSFINALLGRDILPTDVDIATCEVFRVRRAMQEAYRVRFENGSAREITAAQLQQYGSQGIKDSGEAPKLDQIIRWIEVDLPTAAFLPIGVSLLDTPGLGSLYADHGRITQRFVPQADAVIFILDAEKPIVLSELEFIGKILDVTRNIFFVLTKIDQYDDEHWQEIQRRDEAILKERFKDRLADVRIWPFSSANLKQAAEARDDIYLEVSYYKQLAAALQAFLFRTTGWSRCAEALLVADHYYSDSEKILLGRLAALTETSKQKLDALQQTTTRRRQDFEIEWGTNGRKSREVLASIQKTANTHRRNFVALLAAGGKLETTYRQKIDALKSPEEAKKLSETLDESVVTEILNTWRTTCEQAYNECTALLAPFIEATNELLPTLDVDEPDLVLRMKSTDDIKSDLLAKVKEADTSLKAGLQVSAGAVLTAGWLVGILFPPAALPIYLVGLPAVLAVGVWSAFRGWKGVQKKQMEDAQKELHSHLTELIHEIRMRFLQGDLAGGLSVVNHYFNTLVETMTEQLQEIAAAKSGQARAESARLDEQSRLNEQERKERAAKVQQQLTGWGAIGRTIEAIMADLKVLDQSL